MSLPSGPGCAVMSQMLSKEDLKIIEKSKKRSEAAKKAAATREAKKVKAVKELEIKEGDDFKTLVNCVEHLVFQNRIPIQLLGNLQSIIPSEEEDIKDTEIVVLAKAINYFYTRLPIDEEIKPKLIEISKKDTDNGLLAKTIIRLFNGEVISEDTIRKLYSLSGEFEDEEPQEIIIFDPTVDSLVSIDVPKKPKNGYTDAQAFKIISDSIDSIIKTDEIKPQVLLGKLFRLVPEKGRKTDIEFLASVVLNSYYFAKDNDSERLKNLAKKDTETGKLAKLIKGTYFYLLPWAKRDYLPPPE